MPKTFKTVRALIYWEYAKLIAGRAMGDRTSYPFVNFTYQRLCKQSIHPAAIIEENKHLLEAGDVCAYCGSASHLQWEHIVPLAQNGPNRFDNMVRACQRCNGAKAARDPYQWHAGMGQTDQIPRIVLGKFLKIVFAEYDRKGLLDDEAFMSSRLIQRTSLSSVFALTKAAS